MPKITKKEAKAQKDATLTNKRIMSENQKKITDLLLHPVTRHCTSFADVVYIAGCIHDVDAARPEHFGFDPSPSVPLTMEQCINASSFLNTTGFRGEIRDNITNGVATSFDDVMAEPNCGSLVLHAIICKTVHFSGIGYLFVGSSVPFDHATAVLNNLERNRREARKIAVLNLDNHEPTLPALETPLFGEDFNHVDEINPASLPVNPLNNRPDTSDYHVFVVDGSLTSLDKVFKALRVQKDKVIAGVITPIGYFGLPSVSTAVPLIKEIQSPIDDFVANCLWWKYFGSEDD